MKGEISHQMILLVVKAKEDGVNVIGLRRGEDTKIPSFGEAG